MAIIKTLLFTLTGLALLGTGGLFALGQYSKSGSARGLVDGQLAPCPGSPNCVSSEAGTPENRRVEPFALDSWNALPGAIAEMGGENVTVSEDYIAASFTSGTFGFVDDLELRRTENAVHVRSASRVGYSDAGANSRRVQILRDTVAQFVTPPDPET